MVILSPESPGRQSLNRENKGGVRGRKGSCKRRSWGCRVYDSNLPAEARFEDSGRGGRRVGAEGEREGASEHACKCTMA